MRCFFLFLLFFIFFSDFEVASVVAEHGVRGADVVYITLRWTAVQCTSVSYLLILR